MSISVTVSGDESTSVISSQLNTGSITVSGSESIQVTSAGVNSATVTISTGDPVTITGNFSNFVTGSVVRPDDISSFITSSNLSALETATGDLNTRVNSNDSDITSLNSATGVLNTATGSLSTATGLLVPKSETGSFLTSGQIDTNISTAVSNLVDSAPSTLDTLNELAASLGDDANFSTSITTSLGNKVNKSETGSFAVTGSDVTFSNLTVSGNILPENNVASDIGSPSKRFKDLYLSGDSIFLGDSRISFSGGATGSLNITGSGITGRFLQDVETGSILLPLQTATGQLSSATGTLNNVNETITGSTGILKTATGSLTGATGALSDATGTLNTNIGTVSGLITSNDSDIADLNTATGLLTGATGALNTATGALNTATGVLNSGIGDLNTTTGILSTATGALSAATGVLQGVTGSFAQTGSGDFGVLNVTGNILLGDGIIDTADGDKLHFGTNDLIANGKHIQAGFSVGVFGNRGNVKGMNQGAADSSDLGLFCNSIEALSIQTGGNLIVNTGNLGIGTTSPQTKLSVVGGNMEVGETNENVDRKITIHSQNAFHKRTEIGYDGVVFGIRPQVGHQTFVFGSNSINNMQFKSDASEGIMKFSTSGTEKLRIDNVGVGIGTTTPAAKLHVSGDSILSGDLTVLNNISLSGNIIDLDGNEIFEILNFDLITNGKHIQSDFSVGVRHDRGSVRGMDQGTNNSDLGLYCNSINALSIQTGGNVIVNTGNLGIGTTSPDTQLHIKSTGDVSLKLEADTDNVNENHNPLMQFLQDSGLISANVGFNGNTNTDFTNAIDNAFYIENTSSAAGFGAIQFASNNQAQLTILSGGNVGIGTNSPQAKLHVSGNTIVSGGNLQIGSTPAYSPTRAIKLHDNGVQFGARVTLVGTNDNGGPGLEMVTDGSLSKRTIIRHEGEGSNDYGLAFFTTDNGTTSEKVRFDGNGGVGIGTSSVTAGKKLDVAGDVKAVGIEASEVNVKDADGYFIENKQFAKFENNTLLFGDHDGENFTTDIFGNGGIPMIRITGDGSQVANTFVGIRNTSPTEALDVSGNILSNGVIKAFNNTQNVAQLEVGRDNNQFLEMKVSDPDCFITANQDSDSNGNHHFVLDRVFAGTGANDFEIRKGGVAQVTVNASGNMGIGTTTPSAPLHVVGSGIITNDFLVTNGNEDHLDIDTNNYIYKFGDISGGDNGSFFEVNSAQGTASVNNAAFGIGVTLPQATLHVNGTATVSGGLTTLGKTTLSSHAFVIETGSFTLGNTHKGATVLLQNSASINITVPSQVSGYVTTFIAETHNPVSFITGSGMSGLNSFNGASDIAGIYGQAQVIYKSAEYAFLGGNVV